VPPAQRSGPVSSGGTGDIRRKPSFLFLPLLSYGDLSVLSARLVFLFCASIEETRQLSERSPLVFSFSLRQFLAFRGHFELLVDLPQLAGVHSQIGKAALANRPSPSLCRPRGTDFVDADVIAKDGAPIGSAFDSGGINQRFPPEELRPIVPARLVSALSPRQ